jgi:hypothetical protein
MNRLITILSFASFLAVSAASAQSEAGTWKLNAAKSKYSGIPAPTSRTQTLEPTDGGVNAHVEGTAGDGTPIKYTHAAKYDGKDYPITGSGAPSGADSVAMKRKDPNTTETTYKKGGKVVMSAHTSISKDGKTMTTTAKGTGTDGKPVNVHAVYEKQ